jgi:hypothetical protein
MSRTALSPLDTARTLQADLCAGRSLVPVAPPAALPLEPSEWVFGVFAPTRHGSLIYQRYYAAEVVYQTNPAVVVGSPSS